MKVPKKFRLTLVRMGIIQKSKTMNAGEDVGEKVPDLLLVGM